MTTIDEIEELRAELRQCCLTPEERRDAERRLLSASASAAKVLR